jgi:uncharacterized membrane protein YgcG
MLSNVLDFVVTSVAAIIVIAMVIFLVKDVLSYLQGQGTSLFKILAKIAGILLIVALVFVAKNFTDKGNTASDAVGTAMDTVIDEVGSGINGGGGGEGGGGE